MPVALTACLRGASDESLNSLLLVLRNMHGSTRTNVNRKVTALADYEFAKADKQVLVATV